MHTLLFLEPGHFHAALTLRVRSPRVDRSVHFYATPGPERDAFTALVRSFNSRADDPTDWEIEVHESPDPERALVEERRGAVVVLAGRNQPKLGTIARLHATGFHVLADKPWLTDGAALPDLERATAGWPLAMDIMTFRHEVVARLAGRTAATPELFGEFDSSADEPAIDLQSVHHLLKVVNGTPLRRPAWYYDTRVQGDGLVDIQSHMTDQSQWLAGDGAGFDYRRDFALEGADRWSTAVPLDLFRASTGRDDFPDALREQVADGVLALACNGEIRYRLRGIPVRQRAEWGQREPDGGGDAHRTTLRGTGATVVARRGPETGFRAELHVAPRDAGSAFRRPSRRSLGDLGTGLPRALAPLVPPRPRDHHSPGPGDSPRSPFPDGARRLPRRDRLERMAGHPRRPYPVPVHPPRGRAPAVPDTGTTDRLRAPAEARRNRSVGSGSLPPRPPDRTHRHERDREGHKLRSPRAPLGAQGHLTLRREDEP